MDKVRPTREEVYALLFSLKHCAGSCHHTEVCEGFSEKYGMNSRMTELVGYQNEQSNKAHELLLLKQGLEQQNEWEKEHVRWCKMEAEINELMQKNNVEFDGLRLGDSITDFALNTLMESVKHKSVAAMGEPQKTYRYEKVTESIFDLKGEFERGELHSPWSAPDDIEYHPISDDESVFISVYMQEELYRRIEIDPIEELAKEFHQIDLNHKNSFTKWDDLDRAIIDAYLEMAKHAIGKCGVK